MDFLRRDWLFLISLGIMPQRGRIGAAFGGGSLQHLRQQDGMFYKVHEVSLPVPTRTGFPNLAKSYGSQLPSVISPDSTHQEYHYFPFLGTYELHIVLFQHSQLHLLCALSNLTRLSSYHLQDWLGCASPQCMRLTFRSRGFPAACMAPHYFNSFGHSRGGGERFKVYATPARS